MTVTVDGQTVNAQQWGAGPDLLLLHGWGASLESMRFLAEHFAPYYRVTALDFPGFGKSDPPPAPWSVEDYARLTLGVVGALGLQNPVLVGHSFGGRVILKLCGTGRLTPPKIVLLDAAGIRRRPSFTKRLRTRCFKIARWWLTRPLWKNACEGLLEGLRRQFGSADYNAAPPVLRQTLVRVVEEDLSPLLPTIAAPTLLIYGEHDTATPVSDAKIMEQAIPDAGLCVIPGAGHWAFAEQPARVTAILDSFLLSGAKEAAQ